MEPNQIEASQDLLVAVRELAREQGRPERELIDEALSSYLAAFKVTPAEDFHVLLDRMTSGFGDLSEGDAMELALEEQRSYRRESAGNPG